jgi:uncharacterized protein (TIGR02996 family)
VLDITCITDVTSKALFDAVVAEPTLVANWLVLADWMTDEGDADLGCALRWMGRRALHK